MSQGDTDKRDATIIFRVTELEKAEIQAAAEEAGRSMSAHLRTIATTSSGGGSVPKLNQDAWFELSKTAGNLNQLAAHLNEWRGALASGDAPGDGSELARRIGELELPPVEVVDRLYEDVGELRRDLLGAQTLLSAADTIDGVRRTLRKRPELNWEREELGELARMLRRLAVEVES